MTTGNKDKEKILCGSFLRLLRKTTARNLRVQSYGDRPDVICVDSETKNTVGIEITELLKCEEGRERSQNARSAKTIKDVLGKHAKGGIVSVGRATVFPRNKQEREKIAEALEESIRKKGSFCEFASHVNSSYKWEYAGFVITEISPNQRRDDWQCILDQDISFRSPPPNEGNLIQTVARKARLSYRYRKVDEMILVIRNTGNDFYPNADVRNKIQFAKGNSYDSVWVINWKMNKLLAQPNIVRADR